MKLLPRPRTLTQSKLVFLSCASVFIYNGVQQRDTDYLKNKSELYYSQAARLSLETNSKQSALQTDVFMKSSEYCTSKR